MIQVKIDGSDFYEKYGLFLTSREIAPPEPQTKFIEIPCRNGSIDLTEYVSDQVTYKDRVISLEFMYLGKDQATTISKIYQDLHGKRADIIFSDDPTFHYSGRISCESWTQKKHAYILKMSIEAEPFKLENQSSTDEWYWDDFNFDEDTCNETGNLTVDGTRIVKLACLMAREFPTFTVSADMTLTYKSVTYTLHQGTQKLYDLILDKGENEFTITGNGTITIEYVGGIL